MSASLEEGTGLATQRKSGRWSLVLSAVLFTTFVIAILAGKASTQFGDGPRFHIGDVPEFLLLFASVIAFVISVLYREAAAAKSSS